MRHFLLTILLGCSVSLWAQSSSPSSDAPAKNSKDSQPAESTPSKQVPAHNPDLTPPRADRVNADALDDRPGESSSKDEKVDLSPPEDDAKAHPQSSDLLVDEGSGAGGKGDVGEFHPWDPHKSAKDVEVGDYYFKRKNYRAAESRYREALYYKDNDAVATFRLAVCFEKLDQPDDARQEYESYLKILPHGPQAEDARKAIDRLKRTDASAKPVK